MEFLLNTEEICYIMKIYNIKVLKGFNNRFHYNPANKDKTIARLASKGYIVKDSIDNDLVPELEAMFKSWSRTVYSMSRPDVKSLRISLYLLCDKDYLLIIERHDKEYKFKYSVASKANMYTAGKFFAQIQDEVVADRQYMLRMSVEDFAEFADKALKEDKDYLEKMAKSWGVDSNELIKLAKAVILTSEADTAKVLTEDYVRNIGIMTKVINTYSGVYLMKHKTYKNRENIILAKGSKDFAIASIYNF